MLKRPIDVALSAIGIALSSPLWLVAAVAILVDGGGPVFYRQERWGKGATKFSVSKFRTMRPSDGPVTQAGVDDPRVTRVGRVLRAMGLDELPQLLSILNGDMSLVGPRALAVGEVVTVPSGATTRYEDLPGFTERLQVRPGLTGWATVHLAKDVPAFEKFQADLRYIEEQSLWLDVRLIAVSLWISVRGRWESRDQKY
jgi:lipopolysaccharide/colanic/teichoic acid biosynthesis glycosyltransferase